MNRNYFTRFSSRILLLIAVLFVCAGTYGVGFTPTDGGLVVNLKPGDRFLLSVIVDEDGNPATTNDSVEYFVCNYPSYKGGIYKYYNKTTIDSLRLIPQDKLATEPSSTSIWRVEAPFVPASGLSLGGICYSIWNYCEEKDINYTPYVGNNASNYNQTQGRLTNNPTKPDNAVHLTNVVFVVPTKAATTSFDPNNTMGRGTKFSSKKGIGFLGMPYREVYWLNIPVNFAPFSYVNASLVGFNTSLTNYKYNNNSCTARPGQALYAYGESKHNPTKRTLFRLYVLDEETVSSCPDANYYFAYSQRFRQKYRMNEDNPQNSDDSTAVKSAVTMDRLTCMDSLPGTKYYQTDWMTVPDLDSARYYVGYKNHFAHKPSAPFEGAYTFFEELPMQHMPDIKAPKGAFGRMMADTTNTGAENLGVFFRPAGVFLKVSTGRNVEMHPEPGDTSWISNEMWHVTDAYASYTYKATLYSGPEFSATDPGFDIARWSVEQKGDTVPVVGGGEIIGQDGWCRVYVNKNKHNGGLEFVPADASKWVKYNNNGNFGDTIETSYPMYGQTKVVLREHRLLKDYDFRGWNTDPDSTKGTRYQPGDTVDLSGGNMTLYAIAVYRGAIRVAISFMKDGKRYFLTHPGVAPRFATARHFSDWTNTWQGMANVDNVEPEYMSTYLIIGKNGECAECALDEYVLDPRRETMHGAEDSVTFYENFRPENEEYIGLYYTNPNTILANNTWAGLFKSSEGWPEPTHPCIDSTKLSSTHYLHREAGVIKRDPRPNNDKSYIQYAPTADGNFNGVASEADGTTFTLSGVGIVDEHYVILPDTMRADQRWVDQVVFDLHSGKHISKQVWSKLIGKQLMMQMQLDDKIVYFHPNNAKTFTTANQLWHSRDYRLTQTFEFIRDARVESLGTVSDNDRPHMTTSTSDFCRMLNSGLNSPIDVKYKGEYIDIVDTVRVTLHTGESRIKEYYGVWKDGAPGLHILPDGSRYRDILVITKTYHHGPIVEKFVLTPEQPRYIFPPMDNVSQRINFTLAKKRVRELHDIDDHVLGEEMLSSVDETSSLHLGPSDCSFTSGGTYFSVSAVTDAHLTVKTKIENTSEQDYDTLVVSTSGKVDGVDFNVEARVPLMQTAMELEEVVWSVEGNGSRYYIMAGSGGLIFRQYELKGNTLYKKEDGMTQLIEGSADAANSDTRYITPWHFHIPDHTKQQVQFFTLYGVNKKFYFDGSSRPGLADGGDYDLAALLTYEYVGENFNDNGNFEEVVNIKYGTDRWLKFTATADTVYLSLTDKSTEASTFSWTYLKPEYYLLNNGDYPSRDHLEFGYNKLTVSSVTTRYKAYRIYSMLVDNTLTYCARLEETDMADLISASDIWKTNYTITHIHDSRFAADSSHLSVSTNETSLVTTVTPSGDSPIGTRYPEGTGPYVNIVDTLDVQISLQKHEDTPHYGFKDHWSEFDSVGDAHLKIPLVRKTYHNLPYDSLICTVDRDEYTYVFPPEITPTVNDKHTFIFRTAHHKGTNVLDVEGNAVAYTNSHEDDHTTDMHFRNTSLTEIRLMDEYGNTPGWCEISDTTDHSITVRCLGNGIRAPRSANIYLAYTLQVEGVWRYINFRVQVMQASRFQYEGNQHLIHSKGASGADLKDGVQQVHENRNIVYYYNPSNAAQSTDQRVELPIRERNFYGWWRWYSLQAGEEDSDIPAEKWQTPPMNATSKYTFPFRIIGDSVLKDKDNPALGKKLVTQGRYTVFHVPSNDYGARKNPPGKAPMVYPPQNKDTVVYALDMSVYYDNLPLSMKYINQVDTAMMDTLQQIIEPTLSLREIYELHPWTEMAERLEGYKDTIDGGRNLRYMEDHTVMAPTGSQLLLTTEQRYSYVNVKASQHSESLLGYYMRDDNWDDGSWNTARKDSMIWCAGWDVPCGWYTYNPKTKTYDTCTHTVTEANDFLKVPAKYAMPTGQESDTVIYCLRARSVKSTFSDATDAATVSDVPGDYWFNICRYTIIYHRPSKYGPLEEDSHGKALITDDEIEQNFEVLERLNFDYNKPGEEYTVYPHPLPWEDASYGFAYPMTDALPDNRPHNANGLTNLANMGEYTLINRIPDFGSYWFKMEQHGGAENGYMIFCDGMSSAGQVAALHLDTTLCEGQKMYFSGFIANPNNEGGKTRPNFLFSVQGSTDGRSWTDITSYMTGEIPDKQKWYQIYFPIEQSEEYSNFRVRVYNMASNDNGNDFILDDMCIFATKPPLMVYQANTTCKNENENDSLTHIVLRVDYQGFSVLSYSEGHQYYTIEQITKSNDSTFIPLEDGYYNQDTKGDTIYGRIDLPAHSYKPASSDSIFPNLRDLIKRFEETLKSHSSNPAVKVMREGYVFEHLDDSIRPVLYVVHSAKMSAQNSYVVHMANTYSQLMSSDCAFTRKLRVRNRMVLSLNGLEQKEKEVENMCANGLYDVGLLVKGTVLLDSVAPVEVTGSCYNDWLLYGDTAEASSLALYGAPYSEIADVISILRADESSFANNPNQFARSIVDVSKAAMGSVQTSLKIVLPSGKHPYDILKSLVDNGFLTLYQSNMTVITPKDSALRYTIFPIPGSGSEVLTDMNVDVCPTPVHISLAASKGQGVPLVIGGVNRMEDELQYPIDVLVDVEHANTSIAIPLDSLMMDPSSGKPKVVLKQIAFLSTNDPHFRMGVDTIILEPDRKWDLVGGENTGYYTNGNDTLVVVPAPAESYRMREGYWYTFGIEMMTAAGGSNWGDSEGDGCPVGTVPFTVNVVPTHLRWDPQTADNRWNNPDNWIGITPENEPIHDGARFAPLQSTYVVIPPMTDGKPYPVLPASIESADSIQQVGFQYNTCRAVRFLSGAALSQQQRLEYDSVIADLSAPYNKWALRSTPVEGLLSGDIFMANADLTWETPMWSAGEFDAAGRNYTTGNASFWLSLYSTDALHQTNGATVDTMTTAAAKWSKVTNSLSLALSPAQGWAVYARTHSGEDAAVRLPKNDDIYYYYTKSGDKVLDLYESGLRAKRAESAGGADKVGKLAFYPGKAATSKTYTLSNGTAATSFVFGNPTMGYIDIWGFIADNRSALDGEIGYMNVNGEYTTITYASLGKDRAITSLSSFLPPMHAIVLKKKDAAATSLSVTLNTNRVLTSASDTVRPLPALAPKRRSAMRNGKSQITNNKSPLPQGIMTVTAVNPASPRCTSKLLLGQGFNDAILRGEDAMLTTINIDNYTNNTTPATPFNIYAVEGTSGLSIDLRDEIVNVPVSFYNSNLPFEPNSYLWFTGVNNIDGELVLYDALTGSERLIMDGICLEIETPEMNHEVRYYIRRRGYNPNNPGDEPQIATGTDTKQINDLRTTKLLKDGHVLILRDGHVYTIFGQTIR